MIKNYVTIDEILKGCDKSRDLTKADLNRLKEKGHLSLEVTTKFLCESYKSSLESINDKLMMFSPYTREKLRLRFRLEGEDLVVISSEYDRFKDIIKKAEKHIILNYTAEFLKNFISRSKWGTTTIEDLNIDYGFPKEYLNKLISYNMIVPVSNPDTIGGKLISIPSFLHLKLEIDKYLEKHKLND